VLYAIRRLCLQADTTKPISDCPLAAGFGGSNCTSCTAGTYSVGDSFAACAACPSGQTSPPGSPSEQYCGCPAGQGLNAVNGCDVCPANFFSLGPLDPTSEKLAPDNPIARAALLRECQPCPPGRVSLAGSTSPNNCDCPPGSFGNTSPCQICKSFEPACRPALALCRRQAVRVSPGSKWALCQWATMCACLRPTGCTVSSVLVPQVLLPHSAQVVTVVHKARAKAEQHQFPALRT
jgi:hypothetical protein